MAKLFPTSRNKYARLQYGILFICCLVLLVNKAHALEWDGHLKYQPLVSSYPRESYFRNFVDSPAVDNNIDSRLNITHSKSDWSFNLDYQLLGKSGDSVKLYNQISGLEIIAPFFPNDSQRLFNLTDYLVDDDDAILLQRLDRLNLTYSRASTVVKIGRQAISWGNGILFNPMDLFNPFDPTAVDKEYKTGDDMAYAQQLFSDGSDLQVLWVGRRDFDRERNHSVNSTAAKYHGFLGSQEFDVLISQHYDDTVLGLAGIWSIGGTIARTDLVYTKIESGASFLSGIANLSYSWVWWEKNISGSLEYFRNGFGIGDANYSPENLYRHPALLKRLNRSESYNLAQDYLGGTLTLELHPLWLLTPNVFYNMNDHSTFFQLISSHDLQRNLQFTGSLSLPFGGEGSEYGGIGTGMSGTYLSTGPALFAQIAWYF